MFTPPHSGTAVFGGANSDRRSFGSRCELVSNIYVCINAIKKIKTCEVEILDLIYLDKIFNF